MKTIKVWDPFVRIFHWAVVAAVSVQLVTAETNIDIHAASGIFIFLLTVVRIIWGFVGTRYARFRNFIYSPTEIWGYLAGLVKRNPRHYIGHNPAGGVMVVALLILLLLTPLAGLKTYGAIGKGPAASLSSGIASVAHADETLSMSNEEIDTFSYWKEIHESLAGILITLVILHILGVIVSGYLHKENLVLPIITGRKKISE
jgi:cytochrome b